MGRPKVPDGNIARIDSRLKGLKDRIGTRLDPFIMPNSKLKSILLGDLRITSSRANTTRSLEEMRRHYRIEDRNWPLNAHIVAAGFESERVEMPTSTFIELLARLIEADPAYYLRPLAHRKDRDE